MAATAVLLTIQACAPARTGVEPVAPPPEPAEPDASLAELEALYQARADSARMRFTEADVRFMQMMIPHHTQALVMSEMAPSHGASASLRTLAARTISAQNTEIAIMRAWLQERGQPVPEIHVSGTRLMVMAPGGDMRMDDMPGMLSDEQMRALDTARGVEFDRLFLTYMIQHHSGAVTMVEELFATDGAALGDEVFKIASDIQVDQRTEINRMQLMLDALPEPEPGR
jgi:uncharacterized protein (DUF305 family)